MQLTILKSLIRLITFIFVSFACGFCVNEVRAETEVKVLQVDFSGEVAKPQVYIIKRALKEANSNFDALIINMDTPGGELSSMLEIMELLSKSKARTICYVNPNAISAGAYIAFACDEIWFSPMGVMGAAESVLADGGDVSISMKRKIESFLSAKTKAISGENSNRAVIQRAMAEPDFELKIGDTILKNKGELLSLTANDAVKVYDKTSLLANGIANSADELVQKIYKKPVKIENLKLTAFEKFSKYIVSFSAILMGIGMFFLFLELKTSGFGVWGIIGICFMLIVFLGSNIAGFAGYEALILFAIGLILLLLEIFLFTGTFICAFLGIVLILASLILSGVNLPEGSLIPDTTYLMSSVWKCIFAIILAFVLLAIFGRFFKSTRLWKKFVLEGGLGMGKNSDSLKEVESSLIGACGVAFTDMAPNGKIEINGNVYDATNVDSAFIKKGTLIEVVGHNSFELKIKSKN